MKLVGTAVEALRSSSPPKETGKRLVELYARERPPQNRRVFAVASAPSL